MKSLTSAWALSLRAADLHVARNLRTSPIETCAVGELIWLRGPELGPQFAAALLKLPALERGVPAPDGTIHHREAPLPFARLPYGPWRPLREVLPAQAPTWLEPGPPPETVEIELVRGWRDPQFKTDPAAAAGMLLSFADFTAYAIAAPAVRLRRWSFALNADGQSLVLGTPMPPLSGVPLVDRGHLLVEAGYVWRPALSPAAVRRALAPEIAANDWLLWTSQGVEVVPAAAFVAASRSAVRLSGPAP
ncbi:MAG TPA: hypothetical protein VNC50_13510 [Planctomycetia bacterium]|nr:hypothetical protein [Planctomycetia bacterium]